MVVEYTLSPILWIWLRKCLWILYDYIQLAAHVVIPYDQIFGPE